jgi:hypothetical protein
LRAPTTERLARGGSKWQTWCSFARCAVSRFIGSAGEPSEIGAEAANGDSDRKGPPCTLLCRTVRARKRCPERPVNRRAASEDLRPFGDIPPFAQERPLPASLCRCVKREPRRPHSMAASICIKGQKKGGRPAPEHQPWPLANTRTSQSMNTRTRGESCRLRG